MTKDSKRTEKRRTLRKVVDEEITAMKLDIIYPKVEMIFDQILTTASTTRVSNSGLIMSAHEKGDLQTRQTVVACGPNSLVKVGTDIEIDPMKFPRKMIKEAANGIGKDHYMIQPPYVTIEGQDYLHISSRDLKWLYK